MKFAMGLSGRSKLNEAYAREDMDTVVGMLDGS